MSSESPIGSVFPFAGMLVLAALGNYFWFSAPLDSYRPEIQSEEHFGHQSVNEAPSMLWQDPIKTTELDYQNKSSIEKSHGLIARKIISKEDLKVTKIIAVMLPKGENVEMVERRKRRRYAMISGLISLDFIPRKTDSIEYAVTKTKCKDAHGDEHNLEDHCSRNLHENYTVVPYEWFDYDAFSKQKNKKINKVLVIWINEKLFSNADQDIKNRPISIINETLIQLTTMDEESLEYELIGPATSNTLVKMITEYCNPEKSKYPIIHSPFATIPNDYLTVMNNSKDKTCQDKFLENKMVRTIPTDEILIEKLVSEIKNRFEPGKIASENIAIISEVDTVFGRMFHRLISDTLKEKLKDSGNVKQFGYFRGVDGITTDVTNVKHGQNKLNDNNGSISIIKKPIGDAQYDYLRRMSDKIALNDIKAIGIFGNDVYDKLLILRSLRKNFPSVLFFTTDLDARFLHPEEYRFTRNMLVASGFGLELVDSSGTTTKNNEVNQGATAPFRDSYQTSLFYTVQKIFGRTDIGEGTAMLYEIGRQGPYLLSGEPIAKNENKLYEDKYIAYLFISMAVFLTALFYQGHLRETHTTRKLWVIFCGFIFVLLYLYVVLIGDKTEPISLIDGVSAWPGLFLRLLVICVAVYYFIKAMCLINENNDEITSELLSGDKKKKDILSRVGEIMRIEARAEDNIKPVAGLRAKIQVKFPKSAIVRMILRCHYIIGFFSFLMSMILFLALLSYFISDNLMVVMLFYSVCICLLCYFIRIIYINFESKNKSNSPPIDNPSNVIYVNCIIIMMWFAAYVLLIPESIDEKTMWFFYAIYGGFFLIWYRYISVFLIRYSGLPFDQYKKLVELGKDSVSGLWYCHLYEGRCNRRITRVLTYTLLYSIFTTSIYAIFTPDTSSVWSDQNALVLYHWILQASTFCMTFMIFYIVDVVDSNNKWMLAFQKVVENRDWQMKIFSDNHSIIESCKYTKIIADRTKVISQIIYYPFIVVLLMLLARISYFDNWGFPVAFLIIVCINFAMIFYLGYRLRIRAEALRHVILKKLKHELNDIQNPHDCNTKTYSSNDAKREKMAIYINSLMTEIHEIKHGAFGSFWDQPLLKGAIVLAGGISVTFSEYAVLMN